MVWFSLVWYGLVWFETTSIQSYCDNFTQIHLVLTDLEKIYTWLSLVRFGLVWFSLVWYGLIWCETTSIWSYCENFIFFKDLKLFSFGIVWSGMRQPPSELSVKVSSKSNLFCLIKKRFKVGLVWFGLKQPSILSFCESFITIWLKHLVGSQQKRLFWG